MAALTVQDITRTGTTPATSVAAAVGGDNFVNDGKVFLRVNTTTTACTVTVDSTAGAGVGLTQADVTVVVPGTTAERWIGPFPPSAFNDADGKCQVTYSAITNVTVAPFRLP